MRGADFSRGDLSLQRGRKLRELKRGREKPINEINPRTLSVSLREACFIANFHRVGWRTFCFMNTKQTSYSEKLRDPRWQKKRLCVMQRDGFACRDCGDEKSTLQVHHCHYEKGGPWMTDERFLLTLCGDCHEKRGDLESDGKRALGFIFANLSNASDDESLRELIRSMVFKAENGKDCIMVSDQEIQDAVEFGRTLGQRRKDAK